MWNVITTECFDEWFDTQSEDLQDEILSVLQILKEVGPNLGRPYVDTLKGSKYPNMKELRVQLLCAGNKAGQNEKRFYKDMINLADSEYSKHIRK